jgi:hypothetical protein
MGICPTRRFYGSRSCFEDREERANAHFFAGREVLAAYPRASDFPVSRKSLTCEFDCPTPATADDPKRAAQRHTRIFFICREDVIC